MALSGSSIYVTSPCFTSTLLSLQWRRKRMLRADTNSHDLNSFATDMIFASLLTGAR